MVGIDELAERVASERESWPGERWRCSRELRAAIVEAAVALTESGWSVGRIAAALGVTSVTLGRWLTVSDRRPPGPGGFRRVEVEATSTGELTLVTPTGYRVEGLDVAGIERLLPALR